MQIKSITLATLQIPLIRPFITAVRQTSYVDDIIVMINTDDGMVGYGSAAATPAITGETQESIISAIKDVIAPRLINQNILEFNKLINLIQKKKEMDNQNRLERAQSYYMKYKPSYLVEYRASIRNKK